MADLPNPVTVNDLLVKAVHDRLAEQNELLAQIRDRLPEPPKAVPEVGRVEVREQSPAVKSAARGRRKEV